MTDEENVGNPFDDGISGTFDAGMSDPFDTGMSDPSDPGLGTDEFIDSIVYSDQDLTGIEDESQALAELDFWGEPVDEVAEISWAAENSEPVITDYSEGFLTEEQIKSLRWFWTKNENQENQDSGETVTQDIAYSSDSVTEDISYVFEETVTEDIGYSSEGAETVFEDISYSSGEGETVTEDISYSEVEGASESYDGMIEESMQTEYDGTSEDAADNAWEETNQSEEPATGTIETNSAIISGIKLEVYYDDEQKIWCLPILGQDKGRSSDELIAMLPDGVYMKGRTNALTVSGWNCDTYVADVVDVDSADANADANAVADVGPAEEKWPENGEFVFNGYIDSVGSISLLVTITEGEDDLNQGDIAVEDIDFADTQGTSCGNNLSWNYDAGTLTISGSGEMYDFRYESENGTDEGALQDAPWLQYKANIEKVKIEYGVSSIGNAAFWQCSSLTSVIIPNSVTRIGRCAFAECSSLPSINLPDHIRKIEYRTFYMCTSLREMNVNPDTDRISATVTFKVVNGSWDEGEEATADRTVTLEGDKGETLKLSANQIPAVGNNPADGYKAGSWDVTPRTDVAITENTTYTYTYAAKDNISRIVTFNAGEGATGTIDPVTVASGTTYTLPVPTAFTAPEGKIFSSWSVKIGDADPVSKLPDESFTVTADTTVTAVWEDTPSFGTHAMVLSGKIGVKFKVMYPEGYDMTNTYVNFAVSDGRTSTMRFNDATSIDGENAVWFICYVNALELADTITATLHYGEKRAVNTYSAMDYISAARSKFSDNANLQEMLNAIQNYGHYMQASGWTDHKNHAGIGAAETLNTENIAAATSAVSSMAFQKTLGDGIVGVSYSLTLNEETKINVFVKPVNGATFTTEGFSPSSSLSGYYQFTTDKIGPKLLGTYITIPVNTSIGDTPAMLTVCPMSYARTILIGNYTDAKKYAMAAYYYYYAAAIKQS